MDSHAHQSIVYILESDQSTAFWGWGGVWGPMTLKFELSKHFSTMHLSTKFNHLMFNRSEVIILTHKPTTKQTKRFGQKHPPRTTSCSCCNNSVWQTQYAYLVVFSLKNWLHFTIYHDKWNQESNQGLPSANILTTKIDLLLDQPAIIRKLPQNMEPKSITVDCKINLPHQLL